MTPISRDEFEKLPESGAHSSGELLDWMVDTSAYSTTEIEQYLKISHAATLSRLSNLMKQGLIKRRVLNHSHYWAKMIHTGDTL